MFFWGKNGRGKTLLAVQVLRSAIKNKLSAYFASYSEIVSMFTNTWKSESSKKKFERNIQDSDFLLIDDLGKEYKSNNNLAESILDKVIRYRKHPVIVTSNSNVEELRKFYGNTWGESLSSLLYGKTIHLHVSGRDYREDMSSQLKDSVKNDIDYTPLKGL